MQRRRLRKCAMAVVTVGLVMLGGSKLADADILLTVSAGTTTDTFDFVSNTTASQAIASIDGYSNLLVSVSTIFPGWWFRRR